MKSDRTPSACTPRFPIGLTRTAALLGAMVAASSAIAASQPPPETPPTNPFRLLNSVRPTSPGVYRSADAPQQSTLYATGEVVETPWELLWRPMCGTEPAAMTPEELRRIADQHEAEFAAA